MHLLYASRYRTPVLGHGAARTPLLTTVHSCSYVWEWASPRRDGQRRHHDCRVAGRIPSCIALQSRRSPLDDVRSTEMVSMGGVFLAASRSQDRRSWLPPSYRAEAGAAPRFTARWRQESRSDKTQNMPQLTA